MRNLSLILLLMLNAFSCSPISVDTLQEDPDVNKVYTQDEIASLRLIINFFDTLVLTKTSTKDVNEAYHKYFESTRHVDSYNELVSKAGLKTSEIKSLADILIERKIFNEIWRYEFGLDYKTKDTLSVSLSLSFDGKHMKLIEILSKKDNYLKEYKFTIEECSCIPPSLIIGFQNIHDKFDFNSEINRLIWAVHFITAFTPPIKHQK